MPISQEKHTNLLKAGAYYRMAYQKLLDRLRKDLDAARHNELRLPLPYYISSLFEVVEETNNKLNPTYGQYIEAGLQYYTPAKVRENERVKQWHQRKRELENPNREQRRQDNRIIGNDIPDFKTQSSEYEELLNIDTSKLPPTVNEKAMEEILAQISNSPRKRLNKITGQIEEVEESWKSLKGDDNG